MVGELIAALAAADQTTPRLCLADLFNKSIGRQSYSCAVRPYFPPDVVGGVQHRPGRGLGQSGAPVCPPAFTVSGRIGTIL